MSRLIFHVDVNSAFLSWEAVRRLEEGEEDIRSIPSIVGGDPNRRSSIVLAKSIPAKKYGITTGEPVAMALRKCPELKIVPSDFGIYAEKSAAFKRICREYTPVVEEFSIDECFLDMTASRKMYPDPVKTAHQIKDRIKRELGFTVNVGIGTNKLLAKMASDFEKPDRVHTLFDHEVKTKMWPLPVGDLFLCGRSTEEKLKKINIRTIGDLAQADLNKIVKLIGRSAGVQLHGYARGRDDSPVDPSRNTPKGYSNEITFEEDIRDYERGEQVLIHLADSVGARTRRDGAKGFCISVTVRGNDMKRRSHQKMLSSPTDSTSLIYSTAKTLFREMWKEDVPLRLMGVSLSELEDSSEHQISLFDLEELGGKKEEKEEKTDRVMDQLREKFGEDIIKRGSMVNSGIKVRKR